MSFLLSYLLISIAAFFNALMDTFENTPNFDRSIFKNLDKTFWCKDVSWNHAKRIFNYPVDAWHLSKSAMVFCFCGAVILFRPHHDLLVHLLSLGVIWNISFWIFYIKLFRA